MKKIYAYGLRVALLLGCVSIQAQAQNQPDGPSYALGASRNLAQQLEAQAISVDGKRTVTLRVSDTQTFSGLVSYREDLTAAGEYLIGTLSGVPNASFFVRIEGSNVDGAIVLHDSKRAYRYTADSQGNAWVQAVDINKVLCVDNNKPADERAPVGNPTGSSTSRNTAVVALQSNPGANGCVLLDFDGQYVVGTLWNNGNPITAAPAGMSDAAIQEFWELVSEDFSSLGLNVTTDEAVFNAYPVTKRMRCIVTPTNTAAPNAGGVAYVQSFKWTTDTPCWVFIQSAKYGGEAASHEIGHTLGLYHDGLTSPAQGYYAGQGNWAPIMGIGYYKPVVQWSKGEYAAANNTGDDLATMAGPLFGVGYRADDHRNSAAAATALTRSGTSLSGSGTIERQTDQDFFSFNCSAGPVNLTINGASRHGNLDIVARLYDSNGTLFGTYDTPSTLGATGLNITINRILGGGIYYVSVDGTGALNPATDGYSDYSSLGSYTISGTALVPPTNVVYTPYGCDGGGPSYPVGNYTLARLQALAYGYFPIDNEISGLDIWPGYEVELFEYDNFQGSSAVFRDGVGCLADITSWDNRASSMKVRPIPVTDLNKLVMVVSNRNSGKALDGTGYGRTDVTQNPYSGTVTQQWRFMHQGGGFYTLINANDGRVLTVDGSSTDDGILLRRDIDSGAENQRFQVLRAGDGYYTLIAEHSGKAVDVTNAATADGASIEQQTITATNGVSVVGTASQQWNIRRRFKLNPIILAEARTASAAAPTLQLYPNPVTDQLTLTEGANLTDGQVRIIGIDGWQVFAGAYNGRSIDVSGLKPGLYTLILHTKDARKLIGRFSKQ